MGVLTAVVGVAILVVLAGYDPDAGSRAEESKCSGGTLLDTQRLADSATAPRVDGVTFCSQIDPTLIPHIDVGRLRISGNRTFARLCDQEVSHMHLRQTSDKCQPLRPLGANAFYFHQPSRALAGDDYEVSVTAAVAHAGRVSEADRAAYFPTGRACMVVHVYADSQAERQGLMRADLVARVDHESLAGPDPQVQLLSKTRALAMGASLDIEVLRAGRIEKLTLTRKSAGLFGYNAITVPVLDNTP
jgi:hypothetical protein